MFSDFDKNENWQFYSSFLFDFWLELQMVPAHSKIVLRDAWIDPFDILQQDSLYT